MHRLTLVTLVTLMSPPPPSSEMMVILLEAWRWLESPKCVGSSWCTIVTGCQLWVTLTRSWPGARSQEAAGGKETGRHRGTSGQEAACGHCAAWHQCLYARAIEEKMRIFITFYLIKRFEVSFDKTKLSEGIFICLC